MVTEVQPPGPSGPADVGAGDADVGFCRYWDGGWKFSGALAVPSSLAHPVHQSVACMERHGSSGLSGPGARWGGDYSSQQLILLVRTPGTPSQGGFCFALWGSWSLGTCCVPSQLLGTTLLQSVHSQEQPCLKAMVFRCMVFPLEACWLDLCCLPGVLIPETT